MSNLLSQASLVMIPSGYKEDTVYSAIPTDGSGDLSFTRASNGTRVNSAGLVEVVAWNLVQNSENFSAVWTNQNATITTNSIVAPNGTTTADSLIAANGVNGASGVYVAENTSVVKTMSCYVKKGSKRWAAFIGYNGNSNCWYDLDNGVVGTRGADYSASSITSVGNGWYRIDAVMTTAIGADVNIGIYAADNDNSLTCTGDGTTVSSYIWGFQLNIGSTAKPYFPTTDRLNVPRLTYQNGGGGCPSLLLEKQSTNLTLYSQDLGNAVHNLLNVTIASNNTTSPDGTQNADKFTETTATGEHIIYDLQSNSAGAHTVSCFLKQGGGTIYPVLRLNNSFNGDYALIIFDFTSGTVINTSNVGYGTPTYTVANLGNGWYRVTMTSTTTGTFGGLRLTASNSATPSFGGSGDISYTGSTSNYFYAYGAQLEASSYPTSYIPTTSSSATRVADLAVKSSISSLFGASATSFFMDFEITQVSNGGNWTVTGYDGSNLFSLCQFDTASNYPRIVFDGGVDINIGTALSIGRHKIAVSFATNDFRAYIDGVLVGTDTSCTYNRYDRIAVNGTAWTGNTNNNNSFKLNQYAQFPNVLTNAELASLTTI